VVTGTDGNTVTIKPVGHILLVETFKFKRQQTDSITAKRQLTEAFKLRAAVSCVL
jgi:hypothetical protein